MAELHFFRCFYGLPKILTGPPKQKFLEPSLFITYAALADPVTLHLQTIEVPRAVYALEGAVYALEGAVYALEGAVYALEVPSNLYWNTRPTVRTDVWKTATLAGNVERWRRPAGQNPNAPDRYW